MSKLICANCGETIEKEQAVFVDGDYYCTECKHCEDGVVACEVCGVLHSEDNIVEVNGKHICVDCLEESDGYAKCPECGEWHRKADMVWCEDTQEWYCEPCADEELFWCEYCEVCHSLGCRDAVTVNGRYGEEIWCEDAAYNNATRCSDCEEYFASDRNGGYTRDGDWVCESCLDESYRYRDECDRWVHEDNWDYDYECCQWCAEDRHSARIADYHDAPPIKFYGRLMPSWRGEFQGIGVEVEIDRDDHDGDDEFSLLDRLEELCPDDEIYFEHDSSLHNGFEIITQPHTIEAFYKMPWREILQACQDHHYSAHDIGTCGLHMHISRTFFGRTREVQDVAIAKLMQFYELYYAEILKVSRRTREQAMHWAANYGVCDKEFLLQKSKDRAGYHGIAVNNSNHDTVELRLTRGTLNYETFMACIDFMITVCRNSRTIGWSKTTDPLRWLNGIKRETRDYLYERSAFEWCRKNIKVAESKPQEPKQLRTIREDNVDEQELWNDTSIWCPRSCNHIECPHHGHNVLICDTVHVFAGCDMGFITGNWPAERGPLVNREEVETLEAREIRYGHRVIF